MISVIMSIYKEKKEWIKESISSILNQSYADFEYIIVIDNPNLDSDIKEYLEFAEKKDRRIRLIYNKENVGLAKSMNIAMQLTQGDYIARMDADDIARENRFAKEIEQIELRNLDVIASNYIIIDENSNEIKKNRILPEMATAEIMLKGNVICHPSVMIKKNSLLEMNGYRNFQRSQDFDLWMRMLAAGKKIGVINEYLMFYRQGKSQSSSEHKLDQYYTHLYQVKLFKERLHTGTDSFSESNLYDYLKTKRITPQKNERFLRSLEMMSKMKKEKNILAKLVYFVKAITLSPTENFSAIINRITK